MCHLEGVTPELNLTFTGIYYEPKCSSEDLDHGVLVVGYGFEGAELDNNKYWIVKNRYKLPKILIVEIENPSWNQYLDPYPQPLSTLLKSQKSLSHLE